MFSNFSESTGTGAGVVKQNTGAELESKKCDSTHLCSVHAALLPWEESNNHMPRN